MAPEQAMAQPVDHRADIYALGLILYDMVVGTRQSSRAESAVAELMARVQQPLPLLRSIDPSLPEGLERIIDRCTQPDPAARYQATIQLLEDLQQLAPDGRRPPTAAFSAPPVTRTVPQPVVQPRRRPVGAMMAAVAVALSIAAIAWVLRDKWLPASPADTQKPMSMAILPFRNATGDANLAWLGKILADMVRTELGQAPGLRLVSSERLTQILGDLRVSPDSDIEPATLERLSQFSNAEVLVSGQFVRFGSSTRLEATLRTPSGSDVPLQAQAANDGEIPQAARTLARAMLDHLSAPRAGSARSALPGPTSQSMTALKAYSEGEQLARQNKHIEARARFEEATTADPSFALAFARLAQTFRTLGYGNEAERSRPQSR